MGHHDILFGLSGHSGDWRAGQTDWQAYRLNAPLLAFERTKYSGALGKQFSFVRVSNSRIRMLALKKAEQNDEIVARVVEIDGKPASSVHIAFASPVVQPGRSTRKNSRGSGQGSSRGGSCGVQRISATQLCYKARPGDGQSGGPGFCHGKAALRCFRGQSG